MIDVTLLVCTRDRAESLGRTLASIARAAAAAPDVAIEAVLVDNGSRDATGAVIAAWATAQTFPVVPVAAPRPGLARARNAGLAHARGRIVAMTDDDCVLHPDHLARLVACFAAAPAPAVIGGRILPGDPADAPVTIKLEDHPMVAPAQGFPGGFVMGANLAFTRDVPAAIGGFDERFGAGAPFVAAEDTDWLFRAQGAGIPVLYDPGFVVDHHHGRRPGPEVDRLLAGYAYGDGALFAKHLFADARAARAFLRDLGDLPADLRPWPGRPEPQRFFYAIRLWHRLRGMVAYARARTLVGPAGFEPAT
ncbi:MAG: glycosyltransferase family A protein [Sphingomonas fennica]